MKGSDWESPSHCGRGDNGPRARARRGPASWRIDRQVASSRRGVRRYLGRPNVHLIQCDDARGPYLLLPI